MFSSREMSSWGYQTIFTENLMSIDNIVTIQLCYTCTVVMMANDVLYRMFSCEKCEKKWEGEGARVKIIFLPISSPFPTPMLR